jgi:DNA replicative helicase MCM subunit Mcm2 (Cdc46/Mcm family)
MCAVFSTIIEANSVEKHNIAANVGLTEEDTRRVRELSQDPQVTKLPITSCQSILISFT